MSAFQKAIAAVMFMQGMSISWNLLQVNSLFSKHLESNMELIASTTLVDFIMALDDSIT